MFTELTILVIVGLLIFFINLIPKNGHLVSAIFLFVLFAFFIPNADASTGIFYAIIGIFNIVLALLRKGVSDPTRVTVFGYEIKGLAFGIFSVIVGFVIFYILRVMSSGSAGLVIGVPNLAISGAGLSQVFSHTAVASLGWIENTFFFNLAYMFKDYILPVLIELVSKLGLVFVTLILNLTPYLVGAGLFTLYHLKSYGLQTSALMFAFIAFIIFSISEASLGEEASGWGHFVWNAWISLQRSVSFA